MRSSKRSGASSSSKPPDRPTFFLDHSLGRVRVRTALRAEGFQAEVLADHFPEDVEDRIWLHEAGARGWVVLTKDKRIRNRRIEIDAIMNAGVAAFVLTAGGLTGSEMADVFVKALPRMVRFLEANPPPFICTITRSGMISRFLPKEKPKRKRGNPSN